MAELNWTRGFRRLYLLAVVVWFAYWLVSIPLEEIHSLQQQAAATHNRTEKEEYWAQETFPAQWAAMFRDMVRNPGSTILVVLLPPVFGYGILLGILATARWILRGFVSP
jgi:hypothetical protein